MRRLTVLLLLLLPLVALAAEPAAPRRTVDTDDVPNPARVLRVAEGGNLQAALDEARPGDQLALAPGAVFTGAFVLPAKQGNGWIVVRTDAPEGDLPPRGTRLTPDASPGLAKILAAGKEPALQTAPGARHGRILGVEIALAPSVPKSYGLVAIGTFDQTAPEAIPHHIVLDRVYVHGRADPNA